jgi:hypothetical protein
MFSVELRRLSLGRHEKSRLSWRPFSLPATGIPCEVTAALCEGVGIRTAARLAGFNRGTGTGGCNLPDPGNYPLVAEFASANQRTGPSSGGKLGPSWGLMPGAARHYSDVGLQSADANKFRVTSGLF